MTRGVAISWSAQHVGRTVFTTRESLSPRKIVHARNVATLFWQKSTAFSALTGMGGTRTWNVRQQMSLLGSATSHARKSFITQQDTLMDVLCVLHRSQEA